jgi:hypothetical protein
MGALLGATRVTVTAGMLGKDRAVPRAALPGAELSTTTATAPVEVTNHEYLRKAATGAGQHKRTSDRSVKGEYLDMYVI